MEGAPPGALSDAHFNKVKDFLIKKLQEAFELRDRQVHFYLFQSFLAGAGIFRCGGLSEFAPLLLAAGSRGRALYNYIMEESEIAESGNAWVTQLARTPSEPLSGR